MPYRSFCGVVLCICFEPERKDRQSFHKFYLQGNVYLYLVNERKGLEKYCQQIANSCGVFSSRLSGFLTSYLGLGQIQLYCLFFQLFFKKKMCNASKSQIFDAKICRKNTFPKYFSFLQTLYSYMSEAEFWCKFSHLIQSIGNILLSPTEIACLYTMKVNTTT